MQTLITYAQLLLMNGTYMPEPLPDLRWADSDFNRSKKYGVLLFLCAINLEQTY